MCLAPIALYIPGIIIRDAEVVTKSYPGFWQDLSSAGFSILEANEEEPSDSEKEGDK